MLRAGQGLCLFAVALLIFGVVMVNSAGLTVHEDEGISLRGVLSSRATIYALVAVAMLFLGSRVPISRLYTAKGFASPIPWILLGMVGLLLAVHIPGLQREMNGSSRWITLGGVSIQPSEFAKWGLLIVLAWHCARRPAAMGKLTTGFLPAIWLVGIICILIAMEDLGTAVLIGLVALAVLVSGGVRIWQAGMIVPLGVIGFISAVQASPYRMKRLLAYINPYDDPQGIGYHIIQSMSAVSGGGLAGRGLGNGVRKFGYLPEDTTDFIFAIICEELGVFGAALVLFLYAGLIACGYVVIRRLQHPFHRLLATGVMLTVGLQAAINVAVVTGVAPTKGIALPLLSHGGTGWALTAFSIGLLVAMDRQGDLALPMARTTPPVPDPRSIAASRSESVPAPDVEGLIPVT